MGTDRIIDERLHPRHRHHRHDHGLGPEHGLLVRAGGLLRRRGPVGHLPDVGDRHHPDSSRPAVHPQHIDGEPVRPGIGSATVAKSGDLTEPITMTVTYSGTCTAGTDTVTVAATSSGADPGSPYTLTWGCESVLVQPPHRLMSHGHGVHHWYPYLHRLAQRTATSLTAQVSFSEDKKGTAAC